MSLICGIRILIQRFFFIYKVFYNYLLQLVARTGRFPSCAIPPPGTRNNEWREGGRGEGRGQTPDTSRGVFQRKEIRARVGGELVTPPLSDVTKISPGGRARPSLKGLVFKNRLARTTLLLCRRYPFTPLGWDSVSHVEFGSHL